MAKKEKNKYSKKELIGVGKALTTALIMKSSNKGAAIKVRHV